MLLGHLAGCKSFQNGHSEAQSESDAMMFYADVSSVGSCQALHSLHPLPFLSVQGMGASNQGDCHADFIHRLHAFGPFCKPGMNTSTHLHACEYIYIYIIYNVYNTFFCGGLLSVHLRVINLGA